MSIPTQTRLRIAADLFSFNDFTDALRSDIEGYIPKFRAGDDVRLELALFDNGTLMDIGNVASLTLEIKPIEASVSDVFDETGEENVDLRGPAYDAGLLLTKTVGAANFYPSLNQTEWDSDAADKAHAIFALSAEETRLAPGDRWLTVSMLSTSTPALSRTVCAGRIRILGGGQSHGEPVSVAGESFYNTAEADARFVRLSQNLADLDNASSARVNLGLGTAATKDTGPDTGAVVTHDGSVGNGNADELTVVADDGQICASGVYPSDFASAAQGAKADSAIQPGDNISGLTNDSGFIDGSSLNAGNLSSGTVPAARLPSATTMVAGAVKLAEDANDTDSADVLTATAYRGDVASRLTAKADREGIYLEQSDSVKLSNANAVPDLFAASGAIAFWVMPTAAHDGLDEIISSRAGTGSWAVRFYGDDTQFEFVHTTSGTSMRAICMAAPSANVWTHVCITFTGDPSDADNVTFYYNGVVQALDTGACQNGIGTLQSTSGLQMGYGGSAGRAFGGYLSGITLLNALPSAAAIATYVQTGLWPESMVVAADYRPENVHYRQWADASSNRYDMLLATSGVTSTKASAVMRLRAFGVDAGSAAYMLEAGSILPVNTLIVGAVVDDEFHAVGASAQDLDDRRVRLNPVSGDLQIQRSDGSSHNTLITVTSPASLSDLDIILLLQSFDYVH